MHNTSHEINSVEDASRKAVTDTLFSPRFYTTDFAEMDRLDVSALRTETSTMPRAWIARSRHDDSLRARVVSSQAPER